MGSLDHVRDIIHYCYTNLKQTFIKFIFNILFL